MLKSPPINTIPIPILTHFSAVRSARKRSTTDEEIKRVLLENEPKQAGDIDPVPRVRIRNRTFISDEAKQILNEYFEQDPYPNWHKRDLLGQKVGLSAEVIRIYYQNRRRLLGTDKQLMSSVGESKDWP